MVSCNQLRPKTVENVPSLTRVGVSVFAWWVKSPAELFIKLMKSFYFKGFKSLRRVDFGGGRPLTDEVHFMPQSFKFHAPLTNTTST